MTDQARGWILAAPASNSGKTLVSAALLRLMHNRKIAVTPYKVGPDYIDPGFLSMAAHKTCYNLDPWAMNDTRLGQSLEKNNPSSHFLIEGVMGLFDGATNGTGSTADLAVTLNLPVILVINAKGQASSVSALAEGFINHRKDVHIAGVIFTNVASSRHRKILLDACQRSNIRIFGMLRSDANLILPGRHLGLIQADENRDYINKILDQAARILDEDIDMDGLKGVAAVPHIKKHSDPKMVPPLGQHIAIARDIAFGFCYPHMLDDWHKAGVTLSFFSPLHDEGPLIEADAIYLPGGYPELHAGILASNHHFQQGLRDAANRKAVIYGECGGYMVLGKGITDQKGHHHKMTGLLDLKTSFAKKKRHLGYRQVELNMSNRFGPKGEKYTGHEFHYSTIIHEQGQALFTTSNALGEEIQSAGLIKDNVMGSFIHLIDKAN